MQFWFNKWILSLITWQKKCCIVGSPLLALWFYINNSVLLKTSYILHWKLHTSQIHICMLIFTATYYCSDSAGLNKSVTREQLTCKQCRTCYVLPRITSSFANIFDMECMIQFMAFNATGQIWPKLASCTELLFWWLGDIL